MMSVREVAFILHPIVGWCGLCLFITGGQYWMLRLGWIPRGIFYGAQGIIMMGLGVRTYDFIQDEFSMTEVANCLKVIPIASTECLLDPLYGDVWLSLILTLLIMGAAIKHAVRYIPLAEIKHKTKVVDAQWMSIKEAKKLFKDGDVIIGEGIIVPLKQRIKWSSAPLLKSNASTHIITCSGTGGGKTTSVTIPNFLTYPYSMVVLDPKQDLTPVMIKARTRHQNRQVAVINPTRHQDSLNVLKLCDISSPLVLTHIRALTKWICGEKEGGTIDQYFTEAAHSVVECLLTYELFSNPNDPSLRCVREYISRPLDKLQALLKEIYELDPKFGFGIPQKIAGPLYSIPAKQFAGAAGIADTLTKFLIDESVLQCLTEDTIDIDAIIQGELDIVIQLSLDVMGAYPGLSRVLLGSILHKVYHERPKQQVLFLIDEMPRLGYMRILEEARDVGRGLGIKLWIIVQELGQLRKLYGQDGVSSWLENTSIQQFFGIKSFETAKRLVDTLGETTIDISSVSLNQIETSKESRSVSTQKQKRSLITVDEVLQLGADNQIILSEHNKPLKCGKATYYCRKELIKLLKRQWN